MSNPRRSSTTGPPTPKHARSDSSVLRPLAPKPPTPSPRPTTTSKDSSPRTQSLPKLKVSHRCLVCLQVGCRLATHRAFGQDRRSEAPHGHAITTQSPHAGFAASYAFDLGLQYAEHDASAPQIDPMYRLPVRPELNTPEMHRLFHDFFTIESQSSFRIPRPPEIVGDLLCGPFFLPAMQDPALCLSVLATAAAIIPCRSGGSARNVTSLTLFGETMQLMRERIDSNPDYIEDTTIVAATLLWAVNAWFEDRDALASHAESVAAFVHKRKGMANLGFVGAVAQLIRWVDILSSTILVRPCQFLDAPNPTSMLQRPSRRYGALWTSSSTSLAVSVDQNVVLASRDTCRLIEELERANTGPTPAAQYTYIMHKLCFVSTKDTVLRARHNGTNSVEECICIALIILKVKIFHGSDSLRMLTADNALSLSTCIRSLGAAALWRDHPEMLVWLLYVALLAQTNSKEKRWCTGLLYRALWAKFGESQDWPTNWTEHVQSALGGYAWSNVQLESGFDTICAKIEGIRERHLAHEDEEEEAE